MSFRKETLCIGGERIERPRVIEILNLYTKDCVGSR